jgi:hypothetical protein
MRRFDCLTGNFATASDRPETLYGRKDPQCQQQFPHLMKSAMRLF